MNIRDGINAIFSGEALLFLGAGFSSSAKNLMNKNMPTGNQLVSIMQSELNDFDENDLEILSEIYTTKFGENKIITLLINNFTCKNYPDYIEDILIQPWTSIFTTNYDNVVETVYSSKNRQYIFNTTDSLPPNYGLEHKHRPILIVHINGSVNNLSVDGLKRDITLTSSSYITSEFLSSPWAVKFRAEIQRAKAVWIVGYSIYDLNIKKCLYQFPGLIEKCFIANGSVNSESRRAFYESFGQVTDYDTQSLASEIRAAKLTHKTVEEPQITQCFSKVLFPIDEKEFRDRHVIELVTQGICETSFLSNDVTQSLNAEISPTKRYIFPRAAENMILDLAKSKRFIHLMASIGNGKTILSKRIAFLFLQQGFQVYSLKDAYFDENLPNDIRLIDNFSQKSIVIIDDIFRLIRVFDQIFTNQNQNVIWIFTSRSGIAEMQSSSIIERIIEKNEYAELDIDRLTNEDLFALDQFLIDYGLWELDAGLGRNLRIQKLKNEHNSELQSVLVRIIRARFIRDRILDLFKNDDFDNNMRKIIVVYYVLIIMGEHQIVDPLTVSELCGLDTFDVFSNNKNATALREFISVNKGYFTSRSPAFAKVFVESIAGEQRYFVNVLLDVLKRLDQMGRKKIENKYWDIFVQMCRFSFIERLLIGHQKRDWLIYFYEELSGLDSCKGNDHFWLHYSMARMAFHEYETAERYLNTAESLSSKRGIKDDFQIQNQRARLLLMRCIHKDPGKKLFGDFLTASRILSAQIRIQPDRVQPYRWCYLYRDFVNRNRGRLDEQQIDLIRNSSRWVIAAIDKADESIRGNKQVNNTKMALNELIAQKSGN